jgi:hypothetical protein
MSERIYTWLLRLYPRAFQEEYSASSRQLFRDRWNTERGFAARCRLWWDVLADLAVSIPREHRRPASLKPVSGYRLSEEALDAMPTHSLLPVSLALLAALTMGWLGDAPLVPLFVGYGLLALPFTAYLRHTRSARRHLLSFELFLEPDRIARKQPRFDLTLHRNEITRILEGENGLMVFGSDQKLIWVPRPLNGYGQVREHLACWMPIGTSELHEHAWRMKPRYAVSLLVPSYVSALLVRSPGWSAMLALLAISGLSVLLRGALGRPQGVPFKLAPVLILFGLIAALAVKNILVFHGH